MAVTILAFLPRGAASLFHLQLILGCWSLGGRAHAEGRSDIKSQASPTRIPPTQTKAARDSTRTAELAEKSWAYRTAMTRFGRRCHVRRQAVQVARQTTRRGTNRDESRDGVFHSVTSQIGPFVSSHACMCGVAVAGLGSLCRCIVLVPCFFFVRINLLLFLAEPGDGKQDMARARCCADDDADPGLSGRARGSSPSATKISESLGWICASRGGHERRGATK